MRFVDFLIITLATWRLSSFFVNNEDGPFYIFKGIRRVAGKIGLKKGLECHWCNSIWFAFILMFLWVIFGDLLIIIILPLSVSAGVIFVQEFLKLLQKNL